MSAVVVEWKGCCPNRQAQNDLISQVKPLARRNAVRWKRMIRARVRRHKASWKEAVAGRYITQAMADRVLEDDRLTELQHIRLFDHELTGSILVSSSVVPEPAASWSRKAKLLGLRLEMPRGPDKPFLIRSDSIRVFGIDFRLFDPAELENDDYRVSFVFVESEEIPSLNGHIVEVLGRESLLSNSCEAIRSADWLLESPGVYIHYVMGTFMARLLRLVKYFLRRQNSVGLVTRGVIRDTDRGGRLWAAATMRRFISSVLTILRSAGESEALAIWRMASRLSSLCACGATLRSFLSRSARSISAKA